MVGINSASCLSALSLLLEEVLTRGRFLVVNEVRAAWKAYVLSPGGCSLPVPLLILHLPTKATSY